MKPMNTTGIRQWCNPDGTIGGRYEVDIVNMDWVRQIYERLPLGDKFSLQAFIAKSGGDYQVIVDGRGIGFAPINWTRMDSKLNQAPLEATVDLESCDVGGEHPYRVTVHIASV